MERNTGEACASPAPGRSCEVLHVLAPAPVGGLERAVELLVRAQVAGGDRPAVFLSVDRGGADHPLASALDEAGARLEVGEYPARAYLREGRDIRRAVERLHPAVVHTHGYRADVIGGLAARSADVARVSTLHGFTGGGLKNRLYESLSRRVLRGFDAVVAVSRPLGASLPATGIRRDRIHVIPNGWLPGYEVLPRSEARRILGLPGDRPVVGWVGRLSREKGPDVLVRAAQAWSDLAPDRDFLVVVIGDGPEKERLRDQAGRLGVASRLAWPGTVPDAGRLFGAFDAFALSSRTEGTPMVLFEAMQARVPIVAASVGGVPDVLDETEAWLVPPEDPAALARGLEQAMDEREWARARAERAARRLERDFGADAWAERYRRVYEQAAR